MARGSASRRQAGHALAIAQQLAGYRYEPIGTLRGLPARTRTPLPDARTERRIGRPDWTLGAMGFRSRRTARHARPLWPLSSAPAVLGNARRSGLMNRLHAEEAEKHSPARCRRRATTHPRTARHPARSCHASAENAATRPLANRRLRLCRLSGYPQAPFAAASRPHAACLWQPKTTDQQALPLDFYGCSDTPRIHWLPRAATGQT